jgi:hypothetical protein
MRPVASGAIPTPLSTKWRSALAQTAQVRAPLLPGRANWERKDGVGNGIAAPSFCGLAAIIGLAGAPIASIVFWHLFPPRGQTNYRMAYVGLE